MPPYVSMDYPWMPRFGMSGPRPPWTPWWSPSAPSPPPAAGPDAAAGPPGEDAALW